MTERELLSIASDVANGMKHLESKQVILRKKTLNKGQIKELVYYLCINSVEIFSILFTCAAKGNVNLRFAI